MNSITIAEAYKIIENDRLEKEELIESIIARTGATRKAVLRKLNDLQSNEDLEEPFPSTGDEGTEGDVLTEDESQAVPIDESVKLALLKENSKLRQQVKKLSTERGSRNIFLEEIVQNVHSINPQISVYHSEKASSKNNATLCLSLLDWHIGEVEHVPQINSYNYEIAKNRIHLLIKKVLDWCELHRNSYRIDEICLMCAGDFISGDIHEELIRSNEFSCPEQVVKASELLSEVIASFSPHFKIVRAEFVTHDNHGRNTEKVQFSDSMNSYNYIVGYLTQSLVKNLKNVRFNLYPAIQQVIPVQDRRYLLMHGNCIRGGAGGIPLLGINKRAWKEGFLRMNLSPELKFDKIVLGHFHSLALTDEMICCPSVAGTASYDSASCRTAKSAQLAWLVSGRYEFDFIEFYLSEGETN